MPDIYPADIVALTTEGDVALDVASRVVPLITAMAKAYTRGHGFDDMGGRPNADVAAVITTASARMIGNPRQASEAETVGPFTLDRRSRGFEGWTLAELFVLNRYRKRAM